MKLTDNQKRLLLEKARIVFVNGTKEEQTKLLEEIMSMTNSELKSSLREFAGERRDKIAEQETRTKRDLDFYDKEAV